MRRHGPPLFLEWAKVFAALLIKHSLDRSLCKRGRRSMGSHKIDRMPEKRKMEERGFVQRKIKV